MQATTEDLKQAIFDEKDRKGKYSPVRQRLTLPPAPGAKAGSALGDGQSLTSYGLQNGAVVQYKDLGMQVCRHVDRTMCAEAHGCMFNKLLQLMASWHHAGAGSCTASMRMNCTGHLTSTHLQVSYKLVFFVEYLGPLLIYPFFWTNAGRSMLHGVTRETHPTTLTQDLALFYWSFHYAKVWHLLAPTVMCLLPQRSGTCFLLLH